MPTTIIQGFTKFRANLEITSLQAQTVSTRQQNVRDLVASDFLVSESFLTGSYKRNTMIAPLGQADVDLFVVLHADYFNNYTQVGLLEAVRSSLRKQYPSTPRFSKNGQAVTITFSDFQMDVVPAFYRQGGGYLIPNASRHQWIATDRFDRKLRQRFVETQRCDKCVEVRAASAAGDNADNRRDLLDSVRRRNPAPVQRRLAVLFEEKYERGRANAGVE